MFFVLCTLYFVLVFFECGKPEKVPGTKYKDQSTKIKEPKYKDQRPKTKARSHTFPAIT